MPNKRVPAFSNETEEARWWFEHRAETGNALVTASRQGRNGEGSVARRARKLNELQVEQNQEPMDRREDTIKRSHA